MFYGEGSFVKARVDDGQALASFEGKLGAQQPNLPFNIHHSLFFTPLPLHRVISSHTGSGRATEGIDGRRAFRLVHATRSITAGFNRLAGV